MPANISQLSFSHKVVFLKWDITLTSLTPTFRFSIFFFTCHAVPNCCTHSGVTQCEGWTLFNIFDQPSMVIYVRNCHRQIFFSTKRYIFVAYCNWFWTSVFFLFFKPSYVVSSVTSYMFICCRPFMKEA